MELFEKKIKEAGFKLTEIKEAFIVDEITPYLEGNILKQKLRVRLKEIEDYKQIVREVIDKIKEELSAGCCANEEEKMTEVDIMAVIDEGTGRLGLWN